MELFITIALGVGSAYAMGFYGGMIFEREKWNKLLNEGILVQKQQKEK